MSAADHIHHYFDGLVQRDDDTHQDILDACFGWHNGQKTVMYRFWKGEAVRASALWREAQKAMADDNHGVSDKEWEQLKQLQIWASRQVAMIRAAKDLRDACEEFKSAIERLNLDPYTAEQVRRQACESVA